MMGNVKILSEHRQYSMSFCFELFYSPVTLTIGSLAITLFEICETGSGSRAAGLILKDGFPLLIQVADP